MAKIGFIGKVFVSGSSLVVVIPANITKSLDLWPGDTLVLGIQKVEKNEEKRVKKSGKSGKD